jgi:hypothetical protein
MLIRPDGVATEPVMYTLRGEIMPLVFGPRMRIRRLGAIGICAPDGAGFIDFAETGRDRHQVFTAAGGAFLNRGEHLIMDG